MYELTASDEADEIQAHPPDDYPVGLLEQEIRNGKHQYIIDEIRNRKRQPICFPRKFFGPPDPPTGLLIDLNQGNEEE